ncbi:MAG TPA: acetyltransferase [Kofleriaceae bacterium]|nr:acetyltransferase [Kofleriaceae bacterium]
MIETNRRLCVIGAGPHAKVVIVTARAVGFQHIEVYDDDPQRIGATVMGAPIVAPTSDALGRETALVVLAIGDNRTRARLAGSARCELATLVHPTAHVEPSSTIGPGSVVFARSVIQPDTKLGAHVIVNTAATIDHDCTIGDHVHVAPGAHVAGIVTIGDGVLVGIGASIAPMVKIGAWSRVGAGAAVIHDVPDGVTAVGVPARVR